MKGKFSIEYPDDIECTLTLTMTVERWKKLRNQLNLEYPASDLSFLITTLLDKMTMQLYEGIDE